MYSSDDGVVGFSLRVAVGDDSSSTRSMAITQRVSVFFSSLLKSRLSRVCVIL